MAHNRLGAAQAYVEALRTGDHSAAKAVAKYLAKDILVTVGQRERHEGFEQALRRITGAWPNTPVYIKGDWSDIREEGKQVKVRAKMRPVGAGPSGVNITFSFNEACEIVRVEQENLPGARLVETESLPDFVRERVNNALASDTPICVAYTSEDGRPILSLRGSTRVYSDTQLCIWLRNADGGLARSLEKNPSMTLLYRDSASRSTLIFQGRGHLATSEEIRDRVFDLIPEIEQNHSPDRTGSALIIDLDRVDGGTPDGRVRFVRSQS